MTLHSVEFAGDKTVAFAFSDACLFGHPVYFDYQDLIFHSNMLMQETE